MNDSMTFQIDSNTKSEMTAICDRLGMTPSIALNIFVTAFVREQGMPFDVKIVQTTQKTDVIDDVKRILTAYASDYEEMAK